MMERFRFFTVHLLSDYKKIRLNFGGFASYEPLSSAENGKTLMKTYVVQSEKRRLHALCY